MTTFVVGSDTYLEAFCEGYADCAVWSSVDDDGEPLDRHGVPLDTHAKQVMRADCASFVAANAADLALYGLDPGQCGHDFWLTRNGHGAGFWDRGRGDVGDRLSDAATALGESYLYLSEDGSAIALNY